MPEECEGNARMALLVQYIESDYDVRTGSLALEENPTASEAKRADREKWVQFRKVRRRTMSNEYPRNLTDEELVARFAAVAAINPIRAACTELQAELLRRLSAGNPQGEKAQITHDVEREKAQWNELATATNERGWHGESRACAAGGCENDAIMTGQYCAPCWTKAERSDGRIEHGKVLPVESDIEELRIQGEEWTGKLTKEMYDKGIERLRGTRQSEPIVGSLGTISRECAEDVFGARGTSVERAESGAVSHNESKIKP